MVYTVSSGLDMSFNSCKEFPAVYHRDMTCEILTYRFSNSIRSMDFISSKIFSVRIIHIHYWEYYRNKKDKQSASQDGEETCPRERT